VQKEITFNVKYIIVHWLITVENWFDWLACRLVAKAERNSADERNAQIRMPVAPTKKSGKQKVS